MKIEEADALVSEALTLTLEEIEGLGLAGTDVRERNHLDPTAKRIFEDLLKAPVASTLYRSDLFSGLGPVDVVIIDPAILIELKWSYEEKRSKIFESVWDAIKLSILGIDRESLTYIATGASLTAWDSCESADLFEAGLIDPQEIWKRPLIPSGPNSGTSVGQDLMLGSPSGGRPKACARQLAITPVARVAYRDDYELRVARVIGNGPMTTWAV
jgi:hypothetical protein